MKKIIILIVLTTTIVFAREEIPILPLDRGVYIQYTDNSLDLIDVDGMKKSDTVKKAKEEMKEKSISPIRLDNRYLMHQRALDYVTNPTKYFMPPVF